jgi:hypothetical protein
MILRTCGDCRHLDPATVPTQSARKVRYCTKRCTWEYEATPRGEFESEWWCSFWEAIAPGRVSA